MNQETLKQLTALISGIALLLLIVSILRNRMLFRFTLLTLKKEVLKKQFIIIWLNIFLLFFISSIFFSFTYSALDISQLIGQSKSQEYLGRYNYAYLLNNTNKDVQSILDYQDSSIKNDIANTSVTSSTSIKVGVYYNISIKAHNTYIPNVSILAFDNLSLKDNEYISFGNISKDLNISNIDIQTASLDNSNTNDSKITLNLKNSVDKNLLDGLEKFRGFSVPTTYAIQNINSSNISNTSNSSSNSLIITNKSTALKISRFTNPNILFSTKKLDIGLNTTDFSRYPDNISPSQYIQEIKKTDLSNQVFTNVNPFITLMIFGIFIYLILLYPLYKALKKLYNLQQPKYEILRSTGAFASIITKYLTYYFIIPFIVLLIFACISAFTITSLIYKFFDLSFIYNFAKPEFVFSFPTLFFIFTNLFALYFLIIFLIFYSSYTPQQKFKYSKISIFRLTLGIFSIIFGIFTLPLLASLPQESKGLIPFLIFCGPITSILGTTIFLRLKDKYRKLALIISLVIFLIALIILFITNQYSLTPSGIFLLCIISLFLLCSFINELGYKDYPKLITISLSTFIVITVIGLSIIGIVNNSNQKYPFDLTVQTYSANDKSINFDTLFPKGSILSRVDTSTAAVIFKDENLKGYLSSSATLITVDRKGISSKNIIDSELDKFYSDDNSVILPPEFTKINVKVGDTIDMKDLSSNKVMSRKVFKIMSDNSNNDLTGKIIFHNLSSSLKTFRSTLSSVYIIKLSDLLSNNDKSDSINLIKQSLYKYNIFDIQDVDQKLQNDRQKSIDIFQSIKILLSVILIIILLFTITKDIYKGLITFIISFFITLISSILYSSILDKSFQISKESIFLLIIIFLSVIIIYGTTFTYRKIKISK